MTATDPPVRDVVEKHRFDEARLHAWLKAALPEIGDTLQVQQFQGGASNPTFLLTSGDGRRYVLRKKPPGQLLSSAHQVDREYRAMKALEGHIPVPRMRALCEDPEVIGTSFYVMDYLEGRIFRDATLPDQTPAERAAIYDDLNATLAKLHGVDFEAVGLGDYGRPGNYFERQVARWTRQYRDAESESIPAMDALIEKLPARIPTDQSVSIAHGDYRLENVMYHPTEPRIIAVLDWELSTIGHPLADIAYNAFIWRSHAPGWGSLDGVDFKTSGIPTEAEYVDAYRRRTGRAEIADWPFYMAFGIFRLASISQGVYRRILSGTLAMEREAINGCPPLAEQALDILEGRQ
ncbi:MAG: phosphotransferase family protein [Alphaproteobacteria bacterium]|nr:phosphotransferase family protein [Alphaproteobacteria bacterium]MBU1513214.1 phosphotransferase family protein [Alphaproteobacteria bacterium]MBU2095322.1 phosphotransferase family protein [Alphaproteobacteria bacterium]MBU2152237.1 phosphotransferase family protein [Alphaproteobacteria bacterium]MBU2306716.1 phosphotransferase family protein [Alphaproteobacteria bacterium]